MDQASKRNNGAGGERDAPPKPPGSLQSTEQRSQLLHSHSLGPPWRPRRSGSCPQTTLVATQPPVSWAQLIELSPRGRQRPGTSDLLAAAHLPFRLHGLHAARSAHKSCVLEATACRLRDRTPSHCLFVSAHKLVPCGSGVELRRLGSGETQGRDGPVPGTSMEH